MNPSFWLIKKYKFPIEGAEGEFHEVIEVDEFSNKEDLNKSVVKIQTDNLDFMEVISGFSLVKRGM